MIDAFILTTGMVPSDSLDDEAMEILVSHAEAFLRAGGVLSISDWGALTEDSRSAFIAAGNAIQRDKAVLLSKTLQSPTHALYIKSQNDDGEELVSHALSLAMKSAEERLRNGRPIRL